MYRRMVALLLLLAAQVGVQAQTPEVPEITRLTIAPDGHMQLHWRVQRPSEVDGFIVVRRIVGHPDAVDGTYHDIATVSGGSSSSYTDLSTLFGSPNPDVRPESYRLKSYKMQGDEQVISQRMSEPHNSIYLLPPQFDWCTEQVSLLWHHYLGWGSQLSAYVVYARAQGNAVFEQVGRVAPTDTVFVHKQPATNRLYEYYIVGLNTGQLSTTRSNTQTIDTHTPQPSALFNADQATVSADGQVEVQFSVGPSDEVLHYDLLHTTDTTAKATELAQLQPTDGLVRYTDTNANPAQIHYYRLQAVGACGRVVAQTNWAQNIVCKATLANEPEGINQLRWTPYQHWLGKVGQYTLYRQIDDQQPEALASFDATHLQTTDVVAHFRSQPYQGQRVAGKFCYWVEASEIDNPLPGVQGLSRSAPACVLYQKFIQAPNAIMPASAVEADRIFRPQVSFVDDYQLKVYNRWGSTVFVSTDPLVGWDGTIDGQLATPGLYIYYIEYSDAQGGHKFYKGQLSVVY